MDPIFEIELNIAVRGSGEASRTLHQQLKSAIVEGRLPPGARLPGTRRSETYFGVSRSTLVDVYEQLLNEGCVATRRGSGTYVVERRVSGPQMPKTNGHSPPHQVNEFWLRPDVRQALGFWEGPEGEAQCTANLPVIDLRPAIVDSRLFPFDVLRQASVKALRALERKPARRQGPSGNQGHFPLRVAIGQHIALTRAVVAAPEDILVTSGAQQAFDVLARALVRAGDIVAFEDPGYPPMRIPFAAAGARLAPVAVDAEGLIVEQLPPGTRVICLCPSHQFPLGVTLSARRRKELVGFARRNGAVIVEDDYDGEFRYEGTPVEALWSSDAAEHVCYVGTFSKCMLPALRLGFVVAPRWAMQTLVAAKNCLDWHSATPIQMTVARFISAGYLARHVRKMREVYRARREVVVRAVAEELHRWLIPSPSFYGLHVAAIARSHIDVQRVTDTLFQKNVRVHDLARYFLGPPTQAGVVLGYGVADLAELRRGIALLRRALQRADS